MVLYTFVDDIVYDISHFMRISSVDEIADKLKINIRKKISGKPVRR